MFLNESMPKPEKSDAMDTCKKNKNTEDEKSFRSQLKNQELLDDLTVLNVKKFAKINYRMSGDIILECLDDDDIQEIILAEGAEGIIQLMELQNSKKRDIESTVF